VPREPSPSGAVVRSGERTASQPSQSGHHDEASCFGAAASHASALGGAAASDGAPHQAAFFFPGGLMMPAM